jgi:hypothetical protein
MKWSIMLFIFLAVVTYGTQIVPTEGACSHLEGSDLTYCELRYESHPSLEHPMPIENSIDSSQCVHLKDSLAYTLCMMWA